MPLTGWLQGRGRGSGGGSQWSAEEGERGEAEQASMCADAFHRWGDARTWTKGIRGVPRAAPVAAGRESNGAAPREDARSGERRCDKMEECSLDCAIASAACYCKYSAG